MNYQEELNHLEEIIEKLNKYGLGNQQLKDDIFLENIKIALIAFKEQLETTNQENILNIIRSMVQTSTLDIIKTFPMVILGSLNYTNNCVLKNNLIINDENYKTFWAINHQEFHNIKISTEYIHHQGLYIKITSPTPLNNEIFNKINFFGKGNRWHYWFNEVLNKKIDILINNIKVSSAKILWKLDDISWSSLKVYNPALESILYHLWCPELTRFFKIESQDFGFHNEIVFKFDCENWDNTLELYNNYFYCINYFKDESLPIKITDDDIFFIKSLENNQKIQEITKVTCKNIPIENIQENTQDFYSERIVANEITVQLSKNIREKYENFPLMMEGYFSNNLEPNNNTMIYENNDGSITSIRALKLIHKLFQRGEKHWESLMAIINKFLKTYKVDAHKTYIIDWWNNLKNYGKLMGYVNNDGLYKLEIIDNHFEILPKILFINNRYQIMDVYCWTISINDKNYNNIFHHYVNNFLKFYGCNYEIIVV